MRIAVVLPRGYIYCPRRANSIETVVRTLLAHSAQRRNVTVICDEGADFPPETGVVTVPAGLSRRKRTQAVAAVLRTLRPELIEHHQQLHASADLARAFPGAANVFYRHTRLEPPKGLIDRLRYARRLKPFDRLVFVSQAAVAEFAADYPAFAARATAVCNPIEAAPWAADPTAKAPLIVFSGRAIADKGLDTVCEALISTLQAEPDWQAELFLGDWAMHQAWAEPHLRPLAAFGDRVTIRCSAPLAEVREATRRAAIALTPSRVREALGLAALEAHAAGAALISSGRGGLSEASGPHAVVIDPNSSRELAHAILGLIREPERRVSLAAAGQAFVRQVHAPQARAGELDALRDDLLRARRVIAPSRATPREDGFATQAIPG